MIDTGLILADVKYGLSNKSHVLLKIEGRSGLASKGIFPTGGIVDPSYRGHIRVALNNFSGADYHVKVGDRIAQFVVYPVYANGSTEHSVIHIEESHDVSDTDRGAKGFGSSGR
jgi:dUTP pyrophosphatase